jgi:glycosyltransferase involved in cell wall biosynthesis
MKVLIGIATYKRPEKLKRLLASIESQSYPDYKVVIMFDNNDTESMHEVAKYYGHMDIEWCVRKTSGYVIGCWNDIHKIKGYDAHLMLCDDVELHKNSLETAVHALKRAGSDTVIGFSQECPGTPNYTFKPYGQTLMGKEFIESFKDVDYQVCCPDYFHWFQDQEMYEHMNSIGKFVYCEEAVLNHYHPCFVKSEMDSTHDIVRGNSISAIDRSTFEQRKSKGLRWGNSFKLLKEGDV